MRTSDVSDVCMGLHITDITDKDVKRCKISVIQACCWLCNAVGDTL